MFSTEFVCPKAMYFTARSLFLCLILCLFFGLAACSNESDLPESRAGVKALVSVSDPFDPTDAATLWRFIGLDDDPSSACPQASGWTTSKLFDLGDGSAIPPRLAAFCLYEAPVNNNPAALDSLITPGLLKAVSPDAMAATVMAAGDQLQDLVWSDLESHFHEQVGAVNLPSSPGRNPRLAILDTGATRDSGSEKYLGNSRHGFSLVNMAKSLVCRGGACNADLTTRLALAYEYFHAYSQANSGRNEAEGGVIGTITELGLAIREEVHTWETKAKHDGLVLNLSVAWDPRFGGMIEKVVDMPLDVRAVYHALEDAACRGALALAAAGNVGGGPEDETGALLPAAWEDRAAPSYPECQKILGATPDAALFPKKGEDVYRPLLYAVGGVQANGESLANSRAGSSPRLVAFGDHAVAIRYDTPAPTEIYTGTSISALVVSTIASAVWDYRPDLRSDQVMQTIYESGEDLERDAEICLVESAGEPCPSGEWTVRRAHLCEAVTAACSSSGGECPSSAISACTAWSPNNDALLSADLSTFSGTKIDLDDVNKPFGRAPECQGESLLFHQTSTSRPTDPCPHWQYYGLPVEPWTGPQPASIPCPGCWLFYSGGKGILYLEVTNDFAGSLTDGTLKIGLNTYNLGLGSLSPGDRAEVTDIPMLTISTTPVTISFTYNGTTSVSNSVLVVGP